MKKQFLPLENAYLLYVAIETIEIIIDHIDIECTDNIGQNSMTSSNLSVIPRNKSISIV